MSELRARFGSARRPERPIAHARPAGTDNATVNAVGQISAAFEVAENARGMLYAFHRMSGEADLALQEGLPALRKAGHAELADEIDDVLVGRGRIGVDASISCGSPEPGWSLGPADQVVPPWSAGVQHREGGRG